MTTTAYFVDVDADAGGDGTTDALSSGDNTHAYQSLASGTTARQGTIATGDIMVFYCAAGTDANTVWLTSGNWTVTDQDGLQLRANDSANDPHGLATKTERHGGVPGAGYAISASSGTMIRIDAPNVFVHGIEASVTDAGGAANGVYIPAAGNGAKLHNFIARSGTNSGKNAYRVRAGSGRNILLWGGDAGWLDASNGGHGLDNATIINCTKGVYDSATSGTLNAVFRNVVTLNCTTDWSTGGRAWSGTDATNATDSATSAGKPAITQTSVSTLEVVDGTGRNGGDLTNPLSITTKLDGNGTDLSGTFTDDITGTRTRTSTFDIGAYKMRADVFRLVLDADGTLDTTNTKHDAGTGTPFYTHMSDSPDGASSDWVSNSTYNTGTLYHWASLENVATDFSSMDAVTVTVDGVLSGSVTNDTVAFSCRIYDADNSTTTPLAGDSGTLLDETNTTRITARAVMATPSGSKAAWDGAYIRSAWAYARTAGPDNIDLHIHALVIDCEYTASVGGGANPHNPLGHPLAGPFGGPI